MSLQNNLFSAFLNAGTPEDLSTSISQKIGDTRQQVKELKQEFKMLEAKIKHLNTTLNVIITISITILGCLFMWGLNNIFK